MNVKHTLEEFIAISNITHHNFYIYLKSTYDGNKKKTIVTCPIHGDFLVTPNAHMRGQGCKQCGIERRSRNAIISPDEILKRLQAAHSTDYTWNISKYTRQHDLIGIRCNTCGWEFKQMLDSHIRGAGCPRCSGNIQHTNETFKIKAISIHGNLFNYDLVSYVDTYTPIKIICNTCGKTFKQRPNDHLDGHGCNICAHQKIGLARRNGRNGFITKANKKHNNRYGYDDVPEDVIGKDIISILCKTHGKFPQMAEKHLNGAGCPICGRLISKKEIKFLDYVNIPDDKEHRQVKLYGKKVDGYDPITNTIYEFLGDYWHGNPELYFSNDINRAVKKSHGQLYQTTMDRLYFLYNHGYNIKYIWENDWIKFTKNEANLPLIIDYIPDIYI